MLAVFLWRNVIPFPFPFSSLLSFMAMDMEVGDFHGPLSFSARFVDLYVSTFSLFTLLPPEFLETSDVNSVEISEKRILHSP